MGRWSAVGILAAAQFVMVLDSSVMNVSISQIVADLDTTIQGVQLAITAYTLVMAAFMLVGAKIGDIWGRERAFAVGLTVYGLGSLTTALSPNLPVLLFGWSLIEGLGAVMVIPAIAALIAANYEGKDRALAYGIIGGVAAAAIAVGPVIGGWVTTNFTWRYVFVGEVVVVVGILLLRGRLKPSPKADPTPGLDIVGAVLSAVGLALVVFGILASSSLGWIWPKDTVVIAGTEITPFGFSPVVFLILGGLGLLGLFAQWSERRQRRGEDPLVDLGMLSIATLRAGLLSLGMQQLILLGTFFVLPVYLQTVLGLDAFETGLKLLPMSATMLVAALLGPRLAARRSPRRVVQGGLVALAIAAFALVGTVDLTLDSLPFALSLAIFGVGVGLLASQLGNVIMSSVAPHQTNEAGGLQGTAQNLGASLGTALIGAIMLSALATGFSDRVADNQALPADLRATLSELAETEGLDVLPVAQVEQLLLDAGLPADEAATIADDYASAQVDALKVALLAVAIFAVLGLWITRQLPSRPLGEASSEASEVLAPAAAGP
jgi:EmrB/QacA subfamily drug resistance transporter